MNRRGIAGLGSAGIVPFVRDPSQVSILIVGEFEGADFFIAAEVFVFDLSDSTLFVIGVVVGTLGLGSLVSDGRNRAVLIADFIGGSVLSQINFAVERQVDFCQIALGIFKGAVVGCRRIFERRNLSI